MALFVVRHQHAAERCPAGDPYEGAKLLNHLSRPNLRQHGVRVQGEAIVHGEHTLYLIVEAADQDRVRDAMQPFHMAGSVDIYPASTCARVVASGGCAGTTPLGDLGAAIDPEEAVQQAIDEGLVVHRAHPLNCETSLPALIGGTVMPNARFYIRNHFQIPDLDAATFRLNVRGLVDRPLSFTLRDLVNMPSQTQVVTLECAGNGRSRFDPPIAGEKWDLGAVSTAEWTGVSLADVLERAGVAVQAREVLFRGADGGDAFSQSGATRFERSLPIEIARSREVLLAYAMNGEPLPVHHGYPVRLIVPRWYAVASVKWLIDIELIDYTFDGHYQSEKYWFQYNRHGEIVREPVTLQRVRSLITEPATGQRASRGELTIRGVAWSGSGQVAHVDVALGQGPWKQARLHDGMPGSWQWWELITRVDTAGPLTIRSRATDTAGFTQPVEAEWNALGYGNNSIHEVRLQIMD